MRVGFVLDESAEIGGGFQQSLSTIAALKDIPEHQIVVLTGRAENIEILEALGIEAHRYRFPFYRRRITAFLQRHPRARRLFSRLPAFLACRLGSFDHILDDQKIDILVCFFLSSIPLYIDRKPFIATVYDLCHRQFCEFPEVSQSWEFSHRELIFNATLPRAIAILASSPLLAEDIARYYRVDLARIAILPFLPATHSRHPASLEEVERVKVKYGLDKKYIFYPAQFWAHKNHVYILEGLKALEDTHGIRLLVAFSGSDYGNRSHVEIVAQQLGLADRVRVLGFIPSEDVNALYTGCEALVMPTYFGPTNVPPLEAIVAGCPVIYSDTPDFRAELANAALYCDLNDPRSLADHLRLLLTDPAAALALRRAGEALLRRTTPQNYVEKFQEILNRFSYLRARWFS